MFMFNLTIFKLGQYSALCGLSILMAIRVLAGCDAEQEVKTKIKVVCTTNIIADGLKNIVDSSFEVSSLMGAGIDPHIYKATPDDLSKLKKADLIFHNGLQLEGKIASLLQKFAERKPVFALSDGLDKKDLRQLSENTYDPHIWFSVPIWVTGLAYATEQLVKLYPAKKRTLLINTRDYVIKLGELDSLIRVQVNQIPAPQRLIVTSHDAFSYFGLTYGLEIKALQGISTLDDFGLKDIANITNLVMERRIKAVFAETSVSNRSIEAVIVGCREQHYDVVLGGKLYSDALGAADTPEGTYIGMLEYNVKTIVEALK